jgi:hypothetical protein
LKGPCQIAADRRVVGLNECSTDIPIGFKLLISGNARKCPSLIFDDPECVGILGDYEQGVARFLEFVDHIRHPAIPELIAEAREFLANPANKQAYILLEPEEVFWFDDEPSTEQADKLLAELADLCDQKQKAILEIEERLFEETPPPGFFARLLGKRTPVRRDDSNDLVYGLGLGG